MMNIIYNQCINEDFWCVYIYLFILVGGFNPSEKNVNGKDDIPYMKWKIKFMFQTTNQYILCIVILNYCILLLVIVPWRSRVCGSSPIIHRPDPGYIYKITYTYLHIYIYLYYIYTLYTIYIIYNIYEYIWIYMNIYEYIWIYMNIY